MSKLTSEESIHELTEKCISETVRAISQEKENAKLSPGIAPYETCFEYIIRKHFEKWDGNKGT